MATLTAKFIEQAKPEAARREVPDAGNRSIKGLYFVIQPSGARSWALRYRYGDRPRKMTLGSYPAFGLADAREAAGAMLRVLADGRDPAGEKRQAKASFTANMIESLLDEFYRRHVVAKNRASTAAESQRLIETRVKPAWKGRRIQDISRRDVLALLDTIADGGAPITANRVLALVRKFFNWAVERGIIDATPCAHLKPPARETSRDRVLTDDELRLVWLAANRIGWPFGPMVKLLVLTGQRREEVAGATWAEFDLDGAMWVIAKERVKNGRSHAVPLSAPVIDILSGLPVIEGERGFILTTTGQTRISGFSRAKRQLDAAMLEIAKAEAAELGGDPDKATLDPWRVHDLRRTFASGCARLGQPIHVIEKTLNHQSGSFSGVAGVYQRHDFSSEKRRALDLWARHVMALVKGKPADNVIAMAGGR